MIEDIITTAIGVKKTISATVTAGSTMTTIRNLAANHAGVASIRITTTTVSAIVATSLLILTMINRDLAHRANAIMDTKATLAHPTGASVTGDSEPVAIRTIMVGVR